MLKRYASQFSQTQFFKKNARLMATITLVVWCWMLVYGLFFYQPQYTAESMVLIKDSVITSSYIEPEQLYSSKTTSSSAANPVLNTMGLLHSSAITNGLWDYFQDKHPEELKKIGIKTKKDWVDYFKNGESFIKAKNKPGTDLITIKFKWSDPKISKEASAVVIASFQKASLDINQAEQKKRSQYLATKVTDIKGQLEASRHEKSAFKRKVKTVDVSKESHELTKMRTSFESRLDRTLARIQGKKAQLEEYQQMLGMSSEQAIEASAIGLNSTLTGLKSELYTLSQTHAFLTTTLTEKNPKVREIRSRMEQVENDIQEELFLTLGHESNFNMTMAVSDSTRSKMVNEMVSSQAELIRLTQESKGLQERLKGINKKIALFPSVEETLSNIEQKERSLSDSLDALRKKHTEAQLKEAQTMSNVFIIDAPRLPKNANFPAPLHLTVLGILAGLIAGVGAIFIRYKYSVDKRVKEFIKASQVFLEAKESEAEAFFEKEGVKSNGDPLDNLFSENVKLNGLVSTLKIKQKELQRYHSALVNREKLLSKQDIKAQEQKAKQKELQRYHSALINREKLLSRQDIKTQEQKNKNETNSNVIEEIIQGEKKVKSRVLAQYLAFKNKETHTKQQEVETNNQENKK